MRLTKRLAGAMLWFGCYIQRDFAEERQYLSARCLRLEVALRRAECERDDWFQIARTLARKFEGME